MAGADTLVSDVVPAAPPEQDLEAQITEPASVAAEAEPGSEDQPQPTIEERLAALEAQKTQLEKENRALQSKIDRETATERRGRLQAEAERQEAREEVRALREASRQAVEKAIDGIEDPDERYKRLRAMQEEERQKAASSEEGLTFFQQSLELRQKYALSDAEFAEYFDPALTNPVVWARNKAAAVDAFRIGWERTQTARKVEERVKKSLSAQQSEQGDDQEHERRSQAAARGALTPDRGKGAPASSAKEDTIRAYNEGRISHEQFQQRAKEWGWT